MIGLLAVAALICAGSLLVGRAVLVLAAGGQRAWSWLAPSLGLSVLMIAAVAGSRIADGDGAAVAIGALVLVCAAIVTIRRSDAEPAPSGGANPAVGLIGAGVVVVVSLLGAALPFLIAGHTGVLGVGLINDDMASHLQIAEHVREPLADPPRFVEGGYPIGPHALVAGLANGLSLDLVDAFSAFTIALAPLLALTVLAALGHLPPARRALAATVAALSYLSAAYLGQGAFKEPLEAVIVIAFAIYAAELVGLGPGTPAIAGDRPAACRVAPAGLLAAASVLNYSVPGLLWVTAVAAVVLLLRYYVIGPRPGRLAIGWRRLWPYALGALVIVGAATASEWGRIADFTRLDQFQPDRLGSDLGNLKHSISPAEALGVWPTGDFRTRAADAGGPTAIFWVGGAFALLVVFAGIRSAWASRRLGLLGGLTATAAIWAVAALVATPYFAAKALAIGAPIVMAISLGWALEPGSRLRAAAAAALLAGALASSFLALRTSPVGPEAHAAELDQIRPRVEDSRVLFLGRDDFIGWELRRSEVDGVVKNHFNVGRVPARYRNPRGLGDKFDIDAVTPKGLRRYDFVLAPRGEPRSDPVTLPFSEEGPVHLVGETRSYQLFKVTGRAAKVKRRTLEEGPAPGSVLRCDDGAFGRRKQRAIAGTFVRRPLIASPEGGELIATDDVPATIRVHLLPGEYDVSVAYDSRRPLLVKGDFIETTMPANLDFRGPTPLFPADRIRVGQAGGYDFTIEPEEPNRLARLLGSPNEAHVRALGVSPAGSRDEVPLPKACGRYVDYYVP